MRVALAPLWHHVHQIVLPYWQEIGFDRSASLFEERLNFKGVPIRDVPHRAMVQARQIYVFSDSARKGSLHSVSQIENATHNLIRVYASGDPSRGFAFSIVPGGRIISDRRDSYTHAFLILALSHAYRLLRDKKLLLACKQTLSFVEANLIDPVHEGLADTDRSGFSIKRQNPLMHYLEALLALHEAEPEGPYLEKATAVVRIFRRRLYQPARGLLPEIFSRDWSIPDLSECFFEPGHHFEWVWLLHRYDKLTGQDHEEISTELWDSAFVSLADGYVCDTADISLKPIKRSTRLWPHAEGLKAAVIGISKDKMSRIPVALSLLRSLDQFLGRPFPAGWIDHFDCPGGKSLVDYVPSSSLYHLYCCVDECTSILQSRAVEYQ